jgi:hypothetical protein
MFKVSVSMDKYVNYTDRLTADQIISVDAESEADALRQIKNWLLSNDGMRSMPFGDAVREDYNVAVDEPKFTVLADDDDSEADIEL